MWRKTVATNSLIWCLTILYTCIHSTRLHQVLGRAHPEPACLLILRTVVRAGRGSNSLLANSLSHWQLRPLLHSSSSWVLQSQEIVKDKKARVAGSKGVARELRRNRLEIVNDVNAVNRMGWGCCRGTWICPHLQIGDTNMHACLSLSTVWCGRGETLNYKMIWMHIDKSWEVTNQCFRCLMLPSRF
jgi:hypothetical protein